jgi:hypothetical protein
MPPLEGLQALEGRVHFGQLPVRLRPVAVRMQGRYRPAPSGLEGVNRRTGGQAQAGQVIERAGGIGHGASG